MVVTTIRSVYVEDVLAVSAVSLAPFAPRLRKRLSRVYATSVYMAAHRGTATRAASECRGVTSYRGRSTVPTFGRRHEWCVDLVVEGVCANLLHPLEDASHFDAITILERGRAEREHLDGLPLVGEPERRVRVSAPRRAAAHLLSRPARRHGLLVEGGGVLRDLGHRCGARPSGGAC